MATTRKAFNFYRSYYDVAMMLNKKDRLQFLQAIFEMQFEITNKTELSKNARFAFLSQMHSLKKQLDGYKSKKINKLKNGPWQGTPEGFFATIEGPWQGTPLQEEEEGKEKGKEQEKEQEEEELEKCMQIALKDKRWASKALTNKNELLAFNDHLILQGIDKKTFIDYKRHFVNWKKKNPKELIDLSKQNRDDSW